MSKWLLRTFLLIITAPILLALFWYLTAFFPHIEDIRNNAKIERKIPSKTLKTLQAYTIIIETKSSVRSSFMAESYRQLAYNSNTTSQISWHLNKTIWYLFSYLHFSDQEIFRMWASCAISGCGKGLSDAALRYFDKDISNMTKRELSDLVAISRSPSFYTSNPSRFKQRTEYVWERVKDK